jgi:hypothetical protein
MLVSAQWRHRFGVSCNNTAAIRNYHVQRFYVDTTGTYSLTVISATGFPVTSNDSLMFLYSPAFLPPSASTNCIAFSDDAVGVTPLITITLQANTPYDVVILNAWSTGVSSPGATFTGQISGPGQICFGAPCSTGTVVVPTAAVARFDDGRVNYFDIGAPVAVYCADGGIRIYAFDGNSVGYLLTFTDEIDGAVPAENMLLAEGGGARIYRLNTGEYQVNMAANADGNEYVLIWTGCPASHIASYHFNIFTLETTPLGYPYP